MSEMDKQYGPESPRSPELTAGADFLQAANQAGITPALLQRLNANPDMRERAFAEIRRLALRSRFVESGETKRGINEITPVMVYEVAKRIVDQGEPLSFEHVRIDLNAARSFATYMRHLANSRNPLREAYFLAESRRPWPANFDKILNLPAYPVLILTDQECEGLLNELKSRIEDLRHHDAESAANLYDLAEDISEHVQENEWDQEAKSFLYSLAMKPKIARRYDF